MQTSETLPQDLEVHETSWANEMGATAPSPMKRAPKAKLTKREYIPYLIFALCASLYFLPFMRILLPGDGDEGLLISGAVRIVHGQVFARDFFEVVGPGTL